MVHIDKSSLINHELSGKFGENPRVISQGGSGRNPTHRRRRPPPSLAAAGRNPLAALASSCVGGSVAHISHGGGQQLSSLAGSRSTAHELGGVPALSVTAAVCSAQQLDTCSQRALGAAPLRRRGACRCWLLHEAGGGAGLGQ